MTWPAPLTLTGRHMRLEPLALAHADGLCDAARDGELWRLWYTAVPSPEGMVKEIERRLALQAAGSMLPFTVIDAAGKVAGMTTYMHIDPVHRRVEIGSTWYASRVQRTSLNTEAKRMLLAHAFEVLAASRSSCALTASTHRAAAPSNAWAHNSTASCATINAPPTAACATPASTASPRPSGPPCGRTSTGSSNARAEPVHRALRVVVAPTF